MSNESFENILSSIVSNDELMSKISKIVDSHKGEDSSASLGEVISEISSSLSSSENPPSEAIEIKSDDRDKKNTVDDFSKSGFRLPTLSKKNRDLLCALKPFMSKRRQDMIDGILRLGDVSEIAKLVR